MGYPPQHETSDLRASLERCRTQVPGGGPAFAGCFRPATLPDPAGKFEGRECLPDRPLFGLQPPDTARNAIHEFNEGGLKAALGRGSSRPHTIHAAFDSEGAKRLQEILHQDPRQFGKPTSLWTLELAAEVSFEEGLTEGRVSAETIRATLARLGIRWQRAKRWIESPDPEYDRKKGTRPADQARACSSGVGSRL